MPQAAPLFALLGIPAPWVTLRPQMLVLDERQQSKLTQAEVGLSPVLDPASDLDALIARPEDTEFLTTTESNLEQLLDQLRGPALELDSQLDKPWNKTADQMRRALQNFGGRVTTAAARRDEVARGRLEKLREFCLPGGKPQERVIAAAHFPGKYGEGFTDAMLDQMRLDPINLQVVAP
jgi:hypothetical protein